MLTILLNDIAKLFDIHNTLEWVKRMQSSREQHDLKLSTYQVWWTWESTQIDAWYMRGRKEPSMKDQWGVPCCEIQKHKS